MSEEENLIFILPFIFLIFKLLLNCINNYTEETLIDDTEKSLTDNTEETLTDNTEETLTNNTEETLTDDTDESETDNTEKDDNEESDEELDDYTNSKINKLEINNKKVNIDLNYKSVIRYIYNNEIKDGFRIIKNTLFNDIKTFKKEDKGYYYLEKIGISVRFKNANDSFNEIINQCEINNIKLYMKIELFDGEIKKIKI